ncbi:MAG TPA: hypothetical protein VKE51_18860 [Vicinamibacterales bacterium]|nr:hypothetical protein [Vicinamibacterales bacterium]
MSAAENLAELNARIDIIEEAYEYFLAYASQGLPSDQGNDSGRQARHYLERCDRALSGLGEFLDSYIDRLGVDSTAPYRAFNAVIDADARHAQAAIQLVLAQPAISSQVVDNLNASIHLRALLTDLFLIDEVLKQRQRNTLT